MWSFFKSKPVPVHTTPVLSHDATPVLSHDVIEAGILAIKGQGVHIAILYATMLGFEHEVLRTADAIQEFWKLTAAEPEFSDEGIARAGRRVIDDVNLICREEVFDLHVYGVHGTDNQHLRPLLDPFRDAIVAFGAEEICAAAEFDLSAFIIRVATQRREADLKAIFAKLDEKRPFLAPLLMRARAKGRNKYGDEDYGEFFDELREFLGTYFGEGRLTFFYDQFPLMLCFSHIYPWLGETADALVIPINGIDFEYWCAARIEEQGWHVRVSKASGDQGIDIEAMKDGMHVAIQCKRYTNPIGNKSVQEAFTGATHYRANKAVVIGTGGYTKAAIELATNTGVLLLDAENISAFTSLVSD